MILLFLLSLTMNKHVFLYDSFCNCPSIYAFPSSSLFVETRSWKQLCLPR